MSLSTGTRLGPYEIVAPLGAGGMGEVYRATDTRLKRQVAIKTLPPALSADPDRLARFQREAEILASLNHPHIAAIYGLEDTEEAKALVMELVDGETLSERLARGPLPVAEALAIARQIAAALEAAHERGVVHRDLKPANIKLRDDGTVKVLDFGLAKLAEPQPPSDASRSPTMLSPAAMTELGMVLGTATYMSPEQARGRPVDKRTDIWAFGAVLYEMLTGRRAFNGDDIAETLAAVITTTPDWTALPPDTPPQVATLVERCLEKDRNARIGDIAVAQFLLADLAKPIGSQSALSKIAPLPPPQRRRWTTMVAAVGASLMAGAALGWMVPRSGTHPPSLTRLQMSVAPADHLPGSIASVRPSRTAMAVSADGRVVVFSGTRGTTTQLYVRRLDAFEATPIAGTEGAAGPFISPDGAWVGFWADAQIKKVPVGGGPATPVCEVTRGNWGASWADDGTIFFATNAGVSKVASAGGTPQSVTSPDSTKGERHLLPHVLPRSKSLLLTTVTGGDWKSSAVVLQPLGSGERRVLLEGAADARYVSTGHLVYLKAGTLMAVPFDAESQRLSGEPAAVLEGVMQALVAPNGADETGAGQFAVSSSGTLLYVRGGVGRNLESEWVWVDRAGAPTPVSAVPAGPYLGPRLAADGQRIAVTVSGGPPDIWRYDLVGGAPTRLTFEGNASSPVWSPDGRRIIYAARESGINNLYIVNADGSGKPERLAASEHGKTPSSWSAAANAIAFVQRSPSGTPGIWTLPLDGSRTPRPFLESRFSLTHPEFSPDGRSMAYVSNESGFAEVYVQAYPGGGEKLRISTTIGTEPIWTADGRELLYRSFSKENTQRFYAVTIRGGSRLSADPPRLLFEAKPGEYDSTAPTRSWNISPDGRRFLLSRLRPSADTPVSAIHVVLNWADELVGAVKRR